MINYNNSGGGVKDDEAMTQKLIPVFSSTDINGTEMKLLLLGFTRKGSTNNTHCHNLQFLYPTYLLPSLSPSLSLHLQQISSTFGKLLLIKYQKRINRRSKGEGGKFKKFRVLETLCTVKLSGTTFLKLMMQNKLFICIRAKNAQGIKNKNTLVPPTNVKCMYSPGSISRHIFNGKLKGEWKKPKTLYKAVN